MKMRIVNVVTTMLFCLLLTHVLIGQDSQPRVFLQAASHGNVWNAHRDQSMEMARDFQKDCPDVKITILQSAADYTVLLNHIEVGLIGRDNQFQIANREGDTLLLREKAGLKSRSIVSGVKAACDLILSDWRSHGPSLSESTSPTSDAPVASAGGINRGNTRQLEATAASQQSETPAESASVAPKNSTLVTSITSGSGMTDAASSGVSIQSQDVARTLGLAVRNSDQGGAEIVRITPDSSASTAGLHVGDVIISVDGKRVTTAAEFTAALNSHPARLNVRLKYLFHTNLGWMPGTEKLLTFEGQPN